MSWIEKYGLKFCVDDDPSKGQEGLLSENHYKPLFRQDPITQSFRKEDTWLDIGANIGAFALRVAPLVGRVVAIEPEPMNMQLMKTSAQANGFNNIIFEEIAVIGGYDQSVALAISNSFSSTHRVGSIRGRENMMVKAKNINYVVDDHRATRIKMDCEGTEAEILEAIDLSPIREIVFEYHFSFLHDDDWSRFYSILMKLRGAGFTILKEPKTKSKSWHTIVWVRKP